MDNSTNALENYIPTLQEMKQIQSIRNDIVSAWKLCGTKHETIPPEGKQLLSLYDAMSEQHKESLTATKSAVEFCPNPICRQLLLAHFIQGIRWEKIADDLRYSLPQIYRYRKKAITLFNEQMEGANQHASGNHRDRGW